MTEILHKVMARAKEAKVKFNKEKIQYKVSNVRYMGHTVTSEGVKADETKIKAITEMPALSDAAGLQRLLGMVKFLSTIYPWKSHHNSTSETATKERQCMAMAT